MSVSHGGGSRRARGDPLEDVLYHVKRVIVGQDALLERMVVALVARGHLLVEGVPGLAKTLAVKTFAGRARRRVPADPVHARPRAGRHRRHADLQPEARRVRGVARPDLRQPGPGRRDQPGAGQGAERACSRRCRSARSRSAGRPTPLPDPFLVMATQNPIESDGTYPLPEAQVDRFMLKVLVDYPSATEEFVIVERMIAGLEDVHEVMDVQQLRALQKAVQTVFVDPALIEYAVRVASATRDPVVGRPPGPRPLRHLRREPAGVDLHGHGRPGAGAGARPPVRAARGRPHDRAGCAPPPACPFLRGTGRRRERAARRRRHLERRSRSPTSCCGT